MEIDRLQLSMCSERVKQREKDKQNGLNKCRNNRQIRHLFNSNVCGVAIAILSQLQNKFQVFKLKRGMILSQALYVKELSTR